MRSKFVTLALLLGGMFLAWNNLSGQVSDPSDGLNALPAPAWSGRSEGENRAGRNSEVAVGNREVGSSRRGGTTLGTSVALKAASLPHGASWMPDNATEPRQAKKDVAITRSDLPAVTGVNTVLVVCAVIACSMIVIAVYWRRHRFARRKPHVLQFLNLPRPEAIIYRSPEPGNGNTFRRAA